MKRTRLPQDGASAAPEALKVILYFFLLILLLFAFPSGTKAQDLFEAAEDRAAGSDAPEKPAYLLRGYIRSCLAGDEETIKDRCAEGSLKLDLAAGEAASAFSEIRYRRSAEADREDEFSFREAWVDLRLGGFDLRLGRQIVVWGRADGFNPTNNVTPQDSSVYSLEEDDKRLGNFALKGACFFSPFKFEAVWVPVWKSSVLPIRNAALPAGVAWGDDEAPAPKWENGAFGLKLDAERPSFDASLSYYYGCHKTPGLRFESSAAGTLVFTRPYRVQVLGADFAAVVGSCGLRGEFACTLPLREADLLNSSPRRQVEYTVGLDREWGDFSLIVQYIGRSLFGSRPEVPAAALAREIARWNRLIFSQSEDLTHSVSLRPALALFHETLKLEVLGLAAFSTEEVFLQPKAVFAISDAVAFTLGAQLFFGPEDSLYGKIRDSRNALLGELKISF